MRRKKILLIPGNNAISHIVKCFSISDALKARGHESCIAVSRRHSPFLRHLSRDHVVLPDIQETDESGFPSVEWFRQPQKIIDCINEEVALMKGYQPDRVLGVFRFTLKASAEIAGIPYDSLSCGCMTPESDDVLGYDDGEPGREIQQIILDGFYRYAGSKLGTALMAFDLPKSNSDIRHMLKGERTFLWDFPEFARLPVKNNNIHVGPLSWNHWPSDAVKSDMLAADDRPLAVVSFGTCTVCVPTAKRIVGLLVSEGYRVILAAGGQREFLDIFPNNPNVIAYLYAPLLTILPHANILVTHGGQMTIFEALQHQVPVAVLPFQPEQAHNGVCLERMGCGIRLISPQPFQGNPDIYTSAFDRMSDREITSRIDKLVRSAATKKNLAEARNVISQYSGAEKIADVLGE